LKLEKGWSFVDFAKDEVLQNKEITRQSKQYMQITENIQNIKHNPARVFNNNSIFLPHLSSTNKSSMEILKTTKKKVPPMLQR